MSEKDKKKMIGLVKEGKIISKICAEDFPDKEYWEIYEVVYSAGEMSSRGLKRAVSNRLKALDNSNKAERKKITNEISDLVWKLYENHKSNQKKLDSIRKLLQ
ncbi:hypothetical protein CEE37_13570 [candidate division LCP-89 bacterium B3_LCP]|uniref:Uncharacterized protein n=1 Tax=candidate division LCP-89 bacterium B3_LCP TaxID=2012998 RepID=A0A532USU1_UNCL8|nr:MAG: hypothetical protein CEE37_13570 [candidate division LCP-89 bacterium B3_LCP]